MTWIEMVGIVVAVSVLIVGVALIVGRLLHDIGIDEDRAREQALWLQQLQQQRSAGEDIAQLRGTLDAGNQQWHAKLQADRQRWDEQIRSDLERARKGKPS